LQKPPLAYWILAASASVFGELSEWTARFPATLSALGLASLMGVWSARWYGRTAGVATALVQITSVWVLIYGRKAEVDMLLCLLTTSAMFLIIEKPGISENTGFSATFRLRWAAIYTLLGLAWLAKFHYGPVMVLVPSVLFFVMERRGRSLAEMLNPLGLMIFAACVMIWPALVLRQLPGAWDIWQRETLGRVVGELGSQPWWFYLPYLLWLPLPWTFWVWATAARSAQEGWRGWLGLSRLFRRPIAGLGEIWSDWRNGRTGGDPRERFLWIWLLVHLAILFLMANKHKHYLNAALPIFSLWAGRKLADFIEQLRRRERVFAGWQTVGLIIAFFGSGIATAAFVSEKWPALSTSATALGLLIALGGSLTMLLFHLRRGAAGGLVAGATYLGCYAIAVGGIVPAQDHRLNTARFCQSVRGEVLSRGVPPRSGPARPGSVDESVIHVYRMGMDPAVHYLGDPVRRLETDVALSEHLHRTGTLHVIAYATDVPSLSTHGECHILRQMELSETTRPPKHPPLVLVELTAPGVPPRPIAERSA
ncbi:MAG: ArnT family glycosyltransferase, partial [Planctomycetaceae bacterium]